MLSVVGGLAVMLGSSPVAAQTAARTAPSTVAPGEMFTVTISVADYGVAAILTETVPDGFVYGDSEHEPVSVTGQEVEFTLIGETEVAYTVTAPDMASSTPGVFEGILQYRDASGSQELTLSASSVMVSADTGPAPVDVGDLQFDVVPAKAVKGAVVSGLQRPIASNPLEWDVTGEVTGELVSIANDGVVGNFQIEETPAGSGKFRLFVVDSRAPDLSGTQAISIAVTYDPDAAVDDDDVTVNLTGDITARNALAFTNRPFSFTIPQSTSANTPIGAFGVSGGIADEYLDGIVSGGPFDVRDSDMTLVYSGSPALEVKIYTLDLTVNGDAGMANRAIIDEVTVTVTASNQAPSAPAIFTATVKENERGAGLVSAGTTVGDASAGVVENDGDDLAYTLMGTDVFAIDPATGMITVGEAAISDSTGGPDDDPETDDADAKYTRSDDGELVDDTDEFSDITYTFQVMVSDGISANNQYITATVTVDVNEPTEKVAAAALPANVTAGMIDHDGDDATDMVPGYDIVVSVTDGDVPMTLVNLGALVSDADSGDDLSFDVSGNPSHVVYDGSTGNMDLTYLPPSADPGPQVDVITVGVSDGFNGADTDDQTLYIEVSITEIPPDAITSNFVGITVAENSTDCSQDDVASGCSLAGIVSDATSFSIESGVDGGDTNYAVANDGTITVLTAPNYEDGMNPAFLVNANNADGLAGLVSVRVAITDVPEAPTLTAIAGVPWVYETAQIGDDVVEKPADQDGPAATDLAISIAASDPDAGCEDYIHDQ